METLPAMTESERSRPVLGLTLQSGLALDTVRCARHGAQPFLGNGLAAYIAQTVGTLIELPKRFIDLTQGDLKRPLESQVLFALKEFRSRIRRMLVDTVGFIGQECVAANAAARQA